MLAESERMFRIMPKEILLTKEGLEELKEMSLEEIESHIHPAESAVGSMNRVDIDESQKIDFANGKHLKADQNNMSSEAPVCIFYNGELCGIGTWDNPNRIKPEKVFIRL